MQEENARKIKVEKDDHLKLIHEANLDGVETLFEDMTVGNVELKKLKPLPFLEESLDKYQNDFKEYTKEFLELIFKQHGLKTKSCPTFLIYIYCKPLYPSCTM